MNRRGCQAFFIFSISVIHGHYAFTYFGPIGRNNKGPFTPSESEREVKKIKEQAKEIKEKIQTSKKIFAFARCELVLRDNSRRVGICCFGEILDCLCCGGSRISQKKGRQPLSEENCMKMKRNALGRGGEGRGREGRGGGIRSPCESSTYICHSCHNIDFTKILIITLTVEAHYGFQSNPPSVGFHGVNTLSVADLQSKCLDAPPRGPIFLIFTQFFLGGGIWFNNRLASIPPPALGLSPPGKSWIRHWLSQTYLKISLIVSIIDGSIRESSSNPTSLRMVVLKP